MINYPLPLLGFSAFSGTGKTTLLTQLLPLLRNQGLRIAVIKHAHHQFEIDHPGKDSYALRKAGAVQMLVASRQRMALVTEFTDAQAEPSLQTLLESIDPDRLDLVLVEGFKREAFHKIELHRPSLGKPLLCTTDPNIIALASDEPMTDLPVALAQLDLNDPASIADFIQQRIHQFRGGQPHAQQRHTHNRQLC